MPKSVSAAAYPVKQVLELPFEAQCTGVWCYASVSQSVIEYLTGRKLTQKKIVEGVIGKGGANSEKNMGNPYEYLDSLGLIQELNPSTGPPPWATIQREINANHPIIVKVGIHYILIVGYEGKSGADKYRRLFFLDPLVGLVVLYASDEGTGESHYRGGFPTGAAGAAAGAGPSEIIREGWKGYILTKRPDEAGAARGGAKKRRITRRLKKY